MKRSTALYHAKQAYRHFSTQGHMPIGFSHFSGGKFGEFEDCEYHYATGDDGETMWHVYLKLNGAVIKTIQTDMHGHPLPINMADIRTISYKGVTVEIRSDDRFFTVKHEGKILGTITRPRIGHSGWSAALTDGWNVGSTFIGPRGALMALVNRALPVNEADKAKKAFRYEVGELIAMAGYAKTPILSPMERVIDMAYEAMKDTHETADMVVRLYAALSIPMDKDR